MPQSIVLEFCDHNQLANKSTHKNYIKYNKIYLVFNTKVDKFLYNLNLF